jgi:hypothetical protein
MGNYVFLALNYCIVITTSFHLWMFQVGYDIFALIINFVNKEWLSCHVIMSLFESHIYAKIVKATQVK